MCAWFFLARYIYLISILKCDYAISLSKGIDFLYPKELCFNYFSDGVVHSPARKNILNLSA